ncbi:hypothetical protein [Rhizobium sp. C4]|uniref:hypothetical protein n=1 Tax=Rhizobium sp. C4 TaxID=1349800 RepID=UPI001E5292A7|nr:hypothetical protein [Rhizobium sp. C4]MCD2175494.1 hypothetical protein [Rhizobium sp. C4]
MNRAQKIFLAAVFALGLTGTAASAAPMDHYFPVVATASDVQVTTLDINARSNKGYNYMLAQPEIYAAEAKAMIGKNPALAARLRSMNVQLNNIVGILNADDGSFTVFLR